MPPLHQFSTKARLFGSPSNRKGGRHLWHPIALVHHGILPWEVAPENLENPLKKAEISAPFSRLSLWLFLCCFWKVMKNVDSVGKGVVTLEISWKFVVELVWVLIICSLYNEELVHMGLIPEMMPSPNHVSFPSKCLELSHLLHFCKSQMIHQTC